MTKTLPLAMRLTITAGIVGAMVGCSNVTPEQLSAVQAQASEALSRANAAASDASNAMQVASEAAAATEMARNAQSAADAALSCCNDNKSRLDSMFERAMRK